MNEGIYSIIRAFHCLPNVWIPVKNDSQLFWSSLTGVIQGCALSGSLFAIAMDPILRWVKASINLVGFGIVRACADDIGGALKRALES